MLLSHPPSARKESKRAAQRTTVPVHYGSKRVAVGYWESEDGRECWGDHWAPTCCYSSVGGKPCTLAWQGMVSVDIRGYSDGSWRVSVWGGDDFGLERETSDEHEARRLFDRINHLVTIDDLLSWGFVPA